MAEKQPERYLIFGWRNNETSGGWGDFLTDAPDMNVAREIVIDYLKNPATIFHLIQIVDLWQLKAIKTIGKRVDTSV